MGRQRHTDDFTLYEEILESTRDEDGVRHRDEAVKLLAEKLATESERVTDFAEARANEVASGFDKSHQPAVDNGQMALDIDSYLVIGDSERVRVDDAAAHHTRQWLGVLAHNHAKVAAAWSAKTLYGEKLLAIQEEHQCSMWKAEQILRGGA